MKKLIMYVCLGLSFAACREGLDSTQEISGVVPNAEKKYNISIIDASRPYEKKEGIYRGEKITYLRQNGKNVYDGDIILSDEELNNGKENAKTNGSSISKNYRWPNGVVYYAWGPQLNSTQKNSYLNAISILQNKAGISFVYRTNQSAYIILDGSNPNSNVSNGIGYTSNYYYVNIMSIAPVGIAIHEIGHALGMYHEQAKWNRDDYININWNNIATDWRPQYNKTGNDVASSGFDFNSVMLYPSYTNAINSSVPTMTRKDGSTWGYNAWDIPDLSAGDVAHLRWLYDK